MDYTQNAKIAQVTEKSLVIGVDVGSGTHYARAFNWRGQELSKKAFSFGNDLGGYFAFTKWLDGYRQSMDAEKVMVGCEPTGHYWFNFARYVKQSGMTLVLVNPYHVKQTKNEKITSLWLITFSRIPITSLCRASKFFNPASSSYSP